MMVIYQKDRYQDEGTPILGQFERQNNGFD